SIFDAINFTDLFNAVKSSDAATKDKIYADVLKVIDTIEESSISRVDILNTIDFGGIDRAGLFEVLDNLDGVLNGFVTMEATLTDDQSHFRNYSININP
ncbi:MAG: hypothetical protein ACYDEJ_16030, partial [Desulfitobacteriaceae bacterium]